mmetsp:Transcript_48404/g.85251  ORF Transcript_48404/g.85251 Transcript_48404/m.85251 type:complete len:676 (-) Transcript_48404:154-2181(-)
MCPGETKYKAACLVPLYDTTEPFYRLPQEGLVTIGRRSNSTIVLKDGAVSGTHCVLTRVEPGSTSFEVEDRSTNGTFVNDARVAKVGQRGRLNEGDILALGKASTTEEKAAASIRIQFRLEVRLQERSVELLGQPSAVSNNQLSSLGADAAGAVTQAASLAMPSSATAAPAPAGPAGPAGLAGPAALGASPAGGSAGPAASAPSAASGAQGGRSPAAPVVPATATGFVAPANTSAEGFAQDLLVQEQQSKAKITGELLLIRRRLDEERLRNEALDRDLRKARAALEDERARHVTVEDARRRLQAELEQLHQAHGQFEELRQQHAELQSRHETVEAELGAQLQRATSLEAAQEHLREDLDRTRTDTTRAEVLVNEARTRLRQTQERAEGVQERQREHRARAEAAQEVTERLKRQLSGERSMWEQLQDQVALLRADTERAEQGQRDATEALASATGEQANLDALVTKSRAGIVEARKSAEEARQRLRTAAEQAEHIRGAAGRFAEATRAHVDQWMRGIADGSSELSGNTAPRYHPPYTTTASSETNDKANADLAAPSVEAPKNMLKLMEKWQEDVPAHQVVGEDQGAQQHREGVKSAVAAEVTSRSTSKGSSSVVEVSTPARSSPKGSKRSWEALNGFEGAGNAIMDKAVNRMVSTSILTAPAIQQGLKRFRPGKAH